MLTPSEQLLQRREDAQTRLRAEREGIRLQISVGMATCGISAGGDAVWQALEEAIAESGATDVAIKRVGCIGQCHDEPLVEVATPGGVPFLYGNVTPKIARDILQHHLHGQPPLDAYLIDSATHPHLQLCANLTSTATARQTLLDSLTTALAEVGLTGTVTLSTLGTTEAPLSDPLLYVHPGDTVYRLSSPADARRIVVEHLAQGMPVAALMVDPAQRPAFVYTQDVPTVVQRQMRIASRHCGIIDPESVTEALAVGEYQALATALTTSTPEQVMQTVIDSGLRGRGGGGYPTGIKWRDTRTSAGQQKYIICNADEGDPGAFMDRNLLEGDPHAIIEGMQLAGYAIGASQGFVYVRAEYPLAVTRLTRAIEQARALNLLGSQILGSDFNFDISLRLGAGAFVCGEETALIHSIEGERGMPRPRPPYPSQRGLWDCPTCINNVETLAGVAPVVLGGAPWYAGIGTKSSKGTKVFALAGKVARTGLVEVPMGITLRDTIFTVGGGIRGGKRFKAVQIGGPSGGCLPEALLDTEVDYESLVGAGVIMGSGGMIVLDEEDCMVDVARFFLQFTQDESCGKCTPCREGTKRMLEILTRITSGQGTLDDLDLLTRLGHTIQRASLCGLGQTAPNPVLSTLRHFRQEYLEHIENHFCAAGVCRALVGYHVIPEKCIGCGACRRACPVACIAGEPRQTHAIDQSRCIKCGACFRACRFNAVHRGSTGGDNQ
ncbi:MAG TPA: NADH-ubiquinone oxidoreductase-F iron-sulfur binding region domain-containing protein [Armatimonadota bacterium]|jgi:NADH:ubiquinone oxidoreductase subunit F (NADH-binding)/(2Fe-2S) ferredoxin/NAD-dependent dihydropyrimidine dehydrogenase PreA subunit